MRRTLSLVLAVIVAVCSAAASSPHVHAYGGHEHSDHQHGPASHGHEHHHGAPAAPAHDHHDAHDAHDADDAHDAHDDGDVARVRIEACDPGDHAIRIPGAAGPTPRAHEQPAGVVSALIVVPPVIPARLAIAPLDVRVHGPPPDTRLPARAPPLTLLA